MAAIEEFEFVDVRESNTIPSIVKANGNSDWALRHDGSPGKTNDQNVD
jgi:hypothetical protein